MNSHSRLCAYLSQHPDWERRLWDEYGLKIRREGPYAIFNYGYDSRFEDPLVQEARGIILDTERLEVVCWPFRKFGNFVESYADDIDWSTACVQEKLDGSIIKLWYSRRQDRWVFSTNAVIDAANAPIENGRNGRSYLDAIRGAENYADIRTEALDADKTYIFELVGPETMVIVPYDRALLYHTGTRHNLTGQETDEDIGVVRPARYPLRSLADCVEAARRLNLGQDGVEHEGFVVVDAQWRRVKVKSPDYLVRHRINTINLSMANCLELLLGGEWDLAQLCALRPRDAAVLKYYDWQLEELFDFADRTAEISRAMYEEYSHDRGALARALKGNPLGNIGFAALGTTAPGREILRLNSPQRIGRLLRPYGGPEHVWTPGCGAGLTPREGGRHD